MTAVQKRRPLYRRPSELGRRTVGVMFEFGARAYGAAAAASVALSDSETARGKSYDAVNAVPNLMERYRDTKYVIEHREQIQTTLDYVHDNAPGAQQVEVAARESAVTLNRITSTYDEVKQAKAALTGLRPRNVLDRLPDAKEHFDKALSARPDLDSIRQLAHNAEEVAPFLRQLNTLDLGRVYDGLLTIMDNFASDEIVATASVMAAAFGIAYVVGLGGGFWGRRGRPGIVASSLQRLGARFFKGWYARNLEYALGGSVYAAARQRIQSDIVADPQLALDPEALRELERYFVGRIHEGATATSGQVRH